MSFGPASNHKRPHGRPVTATAGLLAATAALALAGCGSSGKASTNTTAASGGSSSASTSAGGSSSTSSGSSAQVSSAPGSATSGSITWWASPITSSNPDPRTVLITAFEKAYPNIKVTLQNAPNDTDTNRATLTTQIQGGGGPDVFMGDVIWPAQFGAHQLAVPLSKYLPSSYFSTFANGLVAGATYQNQVYGAPFFEDQGFLYYRKDLLQQDGLAVPTTWEQLVSESKEMQSKNQVKYGFVFQAADYEGATCNFMEFLGDEGGSVLNSNDTSSTLTANNDALNALTFERSLVTQGVSPAAESTYQEAQAMDAFDAGQSAFLRNWDYAYSTSQAAGSSVIGKVGVAPMPTFSGHSAPGDSNIGGWNLYVNPHSKNIAADLTFIKWMTGTDAQNILATQFSEIPTNQSVRTSPSVIASNPVLAVVPKTKLIPRPAQTPAYSQVSQAIYQNVSAAMAGTESPAAAIKAANSAINSALSGSSL
jgi:multiple sugar transport system substrate-binding protein